MTTKQACWIIIKDFFGKKIAMCRLDNSNEFKQQVSLSKTINYIDIELSIIPVEISKSNKGIMIRRNRSKMEIFFANRTQLMDTLKILQDKH